MPLPILNPDPDQSQTEGTQSNQDPPANSPGSQLPDPNPPPQDPPPPAPTKKVLEIPTSAMADIKRKEREKGRKQAEKDYAERLEETAKSLGYKSWADLEASRKASDDPSKNRKPKRSKNNRREEPGNMSGNRNGQQREEHPRIIKRLEADNAKLLEKHKQANRARAHEERRRKEADRKLAAKDAEMELRTAAIKAGVQDIDYALYLLRKKMEGKTAQDLADFDEQKFFAETLRQSHPYLYGTESRPATTSPGGEPGEGENGTGGAPPPPGDPNKAPKPPGSKDAKEMSQKEYHSRLKELGLNDPSVGMPS